MQTDIASILLVLLTLEVATIIIMIILLEFVHFLCISWIRASDCLASLLRGWQRVLYMRNSSGTCCAQGDEAGSKESAEASAQ